MEVSAEAQPKQFPHGFLWGASTASYQVEGGIDNVDWAQAAKSGRVPVCGRACDHYHRYADDFDLAKSLGHSAHRLSIEWARIEPEEGKFQKEEIEHYRTVLRALKSRNMVPFVTLWHFTQPLWFSQRGGFEHKDAPKVFARYCAFVIECLGSEADFWMTINEPQVFAFTGHFVGRWPPFKRNFFAYFGVLRGMMRAHKAAYRAMKEKNDTIRIGIATHNIDFDPAGNPFTRLIAAYLDRFWNHRFLVKTKGHHDFIGLNHYFHHPIGRAASAKSLRSDMNWEIYPESLYRVTMGLVRYRLPIYVTENGLADGKDDRRAEYIRGYIGALHRAITEGADVRGYLYWSLMDNYEWAEGFTQRFGLIEINYETQERRVRPSAHVFERIARGGTL